MVFCYRKAAADRKPLLHICAMCYNKSKTQGERSMGAADRKREIERYSNAHQTVVKSNEIVMKATYNLTAEEQKLLCFVISKIKPTDKEFERYTLSAKDFGELCGIDNKNIYRDFKKMIESFDNKAQWIEIGNNQIRMRVFSEAEYNSKQGSITVVINSRLKKYLLDLQGNYTQYELWNILSLKSKYSIRLYEIFRAHEFKHEIQFKLDDFKKLICADNYSLFANLKERVINRAIKEINEYTDLQVSYDTIVEESRSHKVKGLIFTITKKPKQEALATYWKTVDRVNKRENQYPGQLNLFATNEDMEEVYNATQIIVDNGQQPEGAAANDK